MREKVKILLQKYNQDALNAEEEQLLEEYIEQGWIELEELEDIKDLDRQLDVLFGNRLSYQMRRDFQRMLARDREKRSTPGFWSWFSRVWNAPPRFNLAYALLLILISLALGFQLNNNNTPGAGEIALLSEELHQMRETMMLSMLEKESTGERLKAVSLTREMEEVSDKVAQALLQTLSLDENVNVRLAALDALIPYANDPNVRQGLIQSIAYQESPIVQMAMAETMVALQEKRSIQPLRELLEQENTPPEIQQKIRKSIEVLL